MANGLKRVGLRSDDVNKLVREYQSNRNEGLGPDEAWANAKRLAGDVDDGVLDAWRPEVEKQSEAGTVAAPLVATDLATRANQMEAENLALKKKLADFGARSEALEKEIRREFQAQIDQARADYEKLKDEHEEMILGSATTPKKPHK
jgi:hypothetical protein